MTVITPAFLGGRDLVGTAVRSVLVIDDEPAVAELLADVIGSTGLGVSSASTPGEISRALVEHHDLLVLDLALGALDGVTVMRALAEHSPGMAVVLVSGFDAAVLDTAARIAELQGLRVVGSFEKPVAVQELRNAVAEWAASVDDDGPHPVDAHTGATIDVDADEVLNDGRLWLTYQPKCDAVSGRVTGAEALVRWSHPVSGPVPANELVAAVERAGRTGELLAAVVRVAAADRLSVPALRALDDVAINVAASDLLDERLPERLARTLGAAAPAHCWTLELTETEPILEVCSSLSALARLRLMGFHLAIDDFGHGSSNLERLLSAPFTELKIDATLVAMLSTGAPRDAAVVRGVIELGHARGLSVVAEGVEVADQLEGLRRLGCDVVQGFLLGRPVPPRSFSADRGVSAGSGQRPAFGPAAGPAASLRPARARHPEPRCTPSTA